ncbi:hypothetical protein Dsin_004215 [Dipteronia sinensis]|uniref:MIF4G domain-containing protein n=1 Tax=Dipteronia sinensis TaxID=43782 RepID=A0AAE0BAE4_9ROSI|nr:hypothetical protein Dsin_004215 [Dipteronia sinensis]
MKVQKGKYGHIHLLASLTTGLRRYRDEFAVAVVDEVLEEIRLGLELNDCGMQQRHIAHMRFLGRLYNYEHVDSSVIFDTLYLILIYAHGTSEDGLLDVLVYFITSVWRTWLFQPSRCSGSTHPPEDCFRIRMVITLLETCGHYFDRGSSKRKLDRFLIHFQRSILSKGVLPLDVEFDLQDLFADLRPYMTRYSSTEEVNSALIELEEHECNVSTEMAHSDKHSVAEKLSGRTTTNSISSIGQSGVSGTEENGGVHEDSDSDSRSDTIDSEGHDEEAENEDDDVDEGGGPASDEDDEVHFRQQLAEVDPEEVANFGLA